MKIIGVSGSGIGSGKTSFARRMGDEVWSLAGALRQELSSICPTYKWFDRTQAYKDSRFKHSWQIHAALKTDDVPPMKTVRDALLVYGQWKCRDDERYWVRTMCDYMEPRLHIADGVKVIAIDDVRKVCEAQYLREKFKENFIHFHLVTDSAIPEEVFENSELAALADYQVRWEK